MAPALRALACVSLTQFLQPWVVAAAEDACPATGGSPACRAAAAAAPDVAKPASTGAATAATPTPQTKAETSVPSADIITQEVSELKEFMKTCEERVNLLEELKSTLASGENLSLPESHVRALQEDLPWLSQVAADKDIAAIASPKDYLITKAIISQEDATSFIKFMPLRSPRSSSPSSSTQTALPSALLVAAQEDGTVRLFTPTGELALTFSAGHELPVSHLSVSPSQDEYTVVTGDASGVVRVHKINVRQKRLSKEQKRDRRNSTDERVSQFLGSQVNVTSQFVRQMQAPSSSTGEAPRLTALSLASMQSNKFFVTGDAEGRVGVFTKNGTLRGIIDVASTQGVAIDVLYSHLSTLMYRAGDEWGFIDLDKSDVKHLSCPNFEGQVKNFIIDSQQAARLIVADEDGTIWIFNVKNKKECKVEHRFAKGATRSPIELASVRGFVLGLEQAEGSEDVSLLALNMSHVGKKTQDLAVPSPVVWRKSRPRAKAWSVQKRYQQGDLLAFLSADGREIEIMELIIQVYTPPAQDSFSNFKLPVIAVAIVLVLGYQYIKQKGKFGGGGSKFDRGDFASALRNKRKLGGLKGAAGLRGKRGF